MYMRGTLPPCKGGSARRADSTGGSGVAADRRSVQADEALASYPGPAVCPVRAVSRPGAAHFQLAASVSAPLPE